MRGNKKAILRKWEVALILLLALFGGMAGNGLAQEGEEFLDEEVEEKIVGVAADGEKLVEKIDCRQCHTIQGDGGDVGPDLTNVRLRRSEEWLYQWLDDPSLSRPATGMPGFVWDSDQEIYDIIAYLDTLKVPVDSAKILQEKNRVKAGEKLVAAYDCRACHTIKTGGLSIYPNLTRAGEKLRPEWDKKFIKDPTKWDPWTFMPNFHLSDPEIEAIVAYILSPKE